MRKIEAITICVNYAHDFVFCVERNKKHFHRWLVVTTSTDLDTIELCKKHSLEVVIFDGFTNADGPFQKSKGINEALRKINFDNAKNSDLILHIDADIVLPENFTEKINSSPINYQTLYGIDRAYVKAPITNERIDELFSVINKYQLRGKGTDVNFVYGFFQLFSKKAIVAHGLRSQKMIYPEYSRDASFDDIVFSKLFRKIGSFDLTAIHLGESYVNWKGLPDE
jgi:hypothetical protein